MLKPIHGGVTRPNHLKALDFGCGTGLFCKKLYELGFDVTGIDKSDEMIKKARSYLPPEIRLTIGDEHTLAGQTYDVITSIMVFPFIQDIEYAVTQFTDALSDQGVIVFAVFNPQYIVDVLNVVPVFRDFDSNEHPTKGFLAFAANDRIPVYIRTAKEYDALFAKKGLKKVYEAYPPFTQEFLATYPFEWPTRNPEFLILGYQEG